MNTTCEGCGAALEEGQAFCNRCGKPRPASAIGNAAQKYCTACGAPLLPRIRFCQKCGIRVSTETGPSDSSTQRGPALQVVHSSNSSSSGGKLLKFVLIAVALLMLFFLLVMGSCAYIAYRTRQKAHAIEQAYKDGDAKKVASELGLGEPSNRHQVAQTANSSSNSAGPAEPPLPVAAPVVPVAASGDQSKDWTLKYERTEGGPEADLVVRTGDINNLSFGWPQGFDPFSGNSTPPHQWPDPYNIPSGAPDGTDRVMIGSAVVPGMGDGYSGALGPCVIEKQLAANGQSQPAAISKLEADCKRARQLTMPQPIVLSVGALPAKIDAVLVQLFADDFQPVPIHSHFQVSLNGTRIPSLEYAINALDQSGPIGKLISVRLLPEYWPLLQSGTVKLLIDDPTTHMPDGYAIDFVRILINPHNFKYTVSLTATVTDADKHTPIAGATVTAALQSAATDNQGKCQMSGLPAGLVVATAAAPGYDEGSAPVDLVSGQTGNAKIQLHRHEEGTAALERAITQTGTATVYGIHFDTDSAKLRPDSLPALNAVLGLIKNHPGSRWIISGHTDNQGSNAHNQPLSEHRAASVVAWLTAHGLSSGGLIPQGFGANRPVADNATANGRALNRRVEIAPESSLNSPANNSPGQR
jgi:OmpA-OmpF porin, OOP family